MSSTSAALLAEARALIAVAPWTRDAEVARAARTLLPQLADAYVALHAKVRERAIKEEELPTGYICKRCALCGGLWRFSAPEAHVAPDCPARPMEPTDD